MKRRFLTALSLAAFIAASPNVFAGEVLIPQEEPRQAVDEKPEAAEAKPAEKAEEKIEKKEEPLYYTIVPRDTLWGISKKFLKNPFKWPKLWKLNPYIKNPHLIYPGNIVKITPDGIEIVSKEEAEAAQKAAGAGELPVVTLEPEAEKVVILEPEEAQEPEAPAAPPAPPAQPAPKAFSHFFQRTGFLTDKELDASGVIVRAKEENTILVSNGDTVYISFKDKAGIEKGDRYTIFMVSTELKHPVTRRKMGNAIEVLGSLTVVVTNDVAEAAIDTSYKEIAPGARLMPYREPVTEVEITASEAAVTGYIVSGHEGTENLINGDIAYIDRGMNHGLKKGNLMRIYREVESVKEPLSNKELSLPPIELGTLIVVDPGESTSSCVVLKSFKPINWGDQVTTTLQSH